MSACRVADIQFHGMIYEHYLHIYIKYIYADLCKYCGHADIVYISPYNHTKGFFFNIDEHDAGCGLADL